MALGLKQKLKEGRGIGSGKNYIPWTKADELPKRHPFILAPGLKTERAHHLFSELEHCYFLILQWSDIVIDIRERFPLLPVEETREIAKRNGIRYPYDRKAKEPAVMTLDFLVTKNDGVEIARTVLYSEKLDDRRTIEKLEIERNYWESRKINWGIVTEKEIPIDLVYNLKWISHAYRLDYHPDLDVDKVKLIERCLRKEMLRNNYLTLLEASKKVDDMLGLERGVSLYIIRYLLARRVWGINIKVKIDLNKPLTITTINLENLG